MKTMLNGFHTKLIYLKYDIKYFFHNCKYYRKFRWVRANRRNVLYFVFEPDVKHPGLADRLKAIISLYNVCKKNQYKLKIYFETPFRLHDYLCAKTDWRMDLNELEYSAKDTIIVNETNWKRILFLKPDKQYQCYCYAGNDIPWKFEETGYLWSDLFNELFKPSETLLQAYQKLRMEESYVVIHIRFVNALERFENTFFDNYLDNEQERRSLIDKCKKGIVEVMNDNPYIPVYVISDSKVFLEEITDLQVKTLGTDNIGHTGDKNNADTELKTFLDLYVLSKSKTIYRIRAKELYNLSCFALLAARIGNVPFVNKDL